MLPQGKTRVLLYCHNAVGLGHIVRTVQVAEALVAKSGLECTIITGCQYLPRIRIDARVGTEALPPVRLSRSMTFLTPEGKAGQSVMEGRANHIAAFARTYRPDVFLTDHTPLGLGGELLPTLTAARREGWATSFMWGLRDIQFAPQHAAWMRRPPANPAVKDALGMYQVALGYTDHDWIDPFTSYRNWFLPRQREYVGVVARQVSPGVTPRVPTIVCLSGGGAGAPGLFQLLLEATQPLLLSRQVKLRFVAGPFGAFDQLKVPEEVTEQVELVAERSTDDAVRDASVVISRVGYNTAYTLVQTQLPIIFVPLAVPGNEQDYRGQMLSRLPNIAVVDEAAAPASPLLRAAVERALVSEKVQRKLPFRTDGASRTAEFLTAICDTRGRASEAADN